MTVLDNFPSDKPTNDCPACRASGFVGYYESTDATGRTVLVKCTNPVHEKPKPCGKCLDGGLVLVVDTATGEPIESDEPCTCPKGWAAKAIALKAIKVGA